MRWVIAREFGPARLVETVLIGSADPAARAVSMRETMTSKAAPMCSGSSLSAICSSWHHTPKVRMLRGVAVRGKHGSARTAQADALHGMTGVAPGRPVTFAAEAVA